MVETQGVMTDVENISLEYNGIAKACSSIFAVLEQLHQLNHSYHFSLQYFVDIFNFVLHDSKALSGETDLSKRGAMILRNIFIETYHRTSMSLLQKDRVTLAMLLARASPYKMDRTILDLVLDKHIAGSDISTRPEQRADALSSVSHVALVKECLSKLSDQDWTKLATEEDAEHVMPAIWPSGATGIGQHLWSLLLIKLFRRDRVIPAAGRFVSAVFGQNFFDSIGDLDTVAKQVTASTPIALSSSPGFDASYKVDGLVERTHTACANIAMGSNEGVTSADKAISNAAANGTWVLVKNVHLAAQWLQSLEKRLNSLNPHEDFRLFLSMESSPKIPVNLIRASRILKYEQPAGIRANMKDSISSLSIRANKPPVEKARLYFLLSFLHAVIQERLCYAPALGWRSFWEFNDSDVSPKPQPTTNVRWTNILVV